MPGSTSLPDTSITSVALEGRMAFSIAAMRPSRIATSRTPSMPDMGQMTCPPRSRRSYFGFSAIAFPRRSLSWVPRKSEVPEMRSMLRIRKQVPCHSMRHVCGEVGENAMPKRVKGRKASQSSPKGRRSADWPLGRTSGVPGAAPASNSHQLVHGGLRRVQDYAASVQRALGPVGIGNDGSDQIGGCGGARSGQRPPGSSSGLHARGLTRRATSEKDRRAQACSLTAAGRALLLRMEASARKAHQDTLAPLDRADQAMLLGLLTRLVLAHSDRSQDGDATFLDKT